MQRKRLKRQTEPTVEIPEPKLPNRPTPKWMKIGPKSTFDNKILSKLPGIEKVFDSAWLAVYSGPGYIDVDRCTSKKNAQSVARMFQLRYSRIKIEWLVGEDNATLDNAVRGRLRTKPIQRKRISSKRRRLKS